MVASLGREPTPEELYRAAVIDLLGAVGYGEISAFERLTEDSRMAPRLQDKVAVQGMASAQFAKVGPVCERLAALGVDPYAAMEPFEEAIDSFHAHTAPSDWYESLVKVYVGDGLVRDFYREIVVFLDDDTRALVHSTLDDSGRAEFAVERLRAAIQEDPRLSGRLALWGRRLMGEAFSEAQRVAAERESLTALLTGGTVAGLDLAGIADMFARITKRHVERMSRLGLEH